MAATVDPSKYIKGLTTQKSGGWVVLRHAWYDSGKIYVSGDLGGENSGGINGNGYNLSHTDVDFAVYERIAGSSGSGIKRNVVPIKIAGTGNTSGNVPVVLIFGVDQHIQQTDGQHEYNIVASGKDSHDGPHGCDIKWIPSPAPPPGPYVIVKNKSGHFAFKDSTVTLEIGCFSNPCSGENATHIMVSTDGGPWANSNTFPHTETFSGNGPHNIKVKGVANTIIGKTIDYSFSIGDNDWRVSNLTPVKIIHHEFPDIGTDIPSGFFNFYTDNADIHEQTIVDLLGSFECTANANTSEIVGSGSSAYKLEVSVPPDLQTDSQNVSSEILQTHANTASNTTFTFARVCRSPEATPLDYFQELRTKDFEVHLVFGGYNGMRIWDECTIPNVVTKSFDMASSPDANGEYEFTDAGLKLNVEVESIDHLYGEQYYHIHYPVSGEDIYDGLDADVAKQINILPTDTDTSVQVSIFNSCGDLTSKTFSLKYIGSGLTKIGRTTGSGPASTVSTITTNTSVATTPGYHSLIVNRIGD